MLREELSLTDDQIINFIEKFWNFKAEAIYFIDTGYAFAFRIENAQGLNLFLKICRNDKNKELFESLNMLGVVLYKLKKIYKIEELPTILSTKAGAYFCATNDYILIMYDFIDEAHPSEDFKNLNFYKLALIFIKLHSIPIKKFSEVPKENFDIEYATGIQNLFHNNLKFDKYDQIMLQQLKHHQEFLNKAIDTMLKIKNKIEDINLEFVLIHGDAHHYNILQTSTELFLIDWDNIILAPRERDLWHYYRYPALLKNYHNLIPKYTLNHDLCIFYQIQRFLEDIRYYIEQMNISKKQRALNIKDFLNHWGWKLSL